MTSPAPIAEPLEMPKPDPAAVPALSIDGVSHSYGPRRALIDVSFNVRPASFTALLGLNGAGKSTLLKIVSRITEPTCGQVVIRGRVASLLEVGTGFHPELTGAENILLNGAILGMTRAEIQCKFDEIVDFAEVERFIDTPVKRYSSGMYLRLAFAVAAHLEPEILLVDEVLAVGDAAFQKKCLGRMGDVANSGRTVLFVSHNLSAVNQLCQRGVLLSEGCAAACGPIAEVLERYMAPLSGANGFADLCERTQADAQRPAMLRSISLLNAAGDVADTFFIGQHLTFRFEILFRHSVSGAQIAFIIRNNLGQNIYHVTNIDSDFEIRGEVGTATVRATFPDLALYPGTYVLDCLWLADGRGTELDFVRDCITYHVAEGGPHVRRPLYGHAGLVHARLEWAQECATDQRGPNRRAAVPHSGSVERDA